MSTKYSNSIIFGKLAQPNGPEPTHNLITNSSYKGRWSDATQCMEGYGRYTYPDGSQYLGYFQNGVFNGSGLLHLSTPYNFTYKGEFVDGHLVRVEDMWFDDGLHVNARWNGWNMTFDTWPYCCKSDRRYVSERLEGIRPVGPSAYISKRMPLRPLEKGTYDMEEGIYNSQNYTIQQRPKPFPHFHFMACAKERNWIEKKCRQRDDIPIEKIAPKLHHRIINSNLDCEMELSEFPPSCNFDLAKKRKQYFERLCKKTDTIHSEGSSCTGLNSTELSCSEESFEKESMEVDVQEPMIMSRQYDQTVWGRDPGKATNEYVDRG